MSEDLRSGYVRQLENILDVPIASLTALDQGYSSDAFAVRDFRGHMVFAKFCVQGRVLLESKMLKYLADNSGLPVPKVLFASDDCLISEFLPGRIGLHDGAEVHAADLLAELHEINASRFGFSIDTPVGPFVQCNQWANNWIDFFRENRLLRVSKSAYDSMHISREIKEDIDRIADRLDRFFPSNIEPSLLHGDLWKGNILSENGKVTAIVDPAIYFGNRESELAYGTLYDSPFNEYFFARYREHYPLDEDFFNTRRHILNLYPMINHARMFGGECLTWVKETARRFS